MNFFNQGAMALPRDAQYYFNVCVINVAVRRSLESEFEDVWDLSGILDSRPFVYHFYLDDEDAFDEDEDWVIEIEHHCVVEVRSEFEISFFTTSLSDDDFISLECIKPDDLWRF